VRVWRNPSLFAAPQRKAKLRGSAWKHRARTPDQLDQRFGTARIDRRQRRPKGVHRRLAEYQAAKRSILGDEWSRYYDCSET
jgi:hypothetical protein